MVRIANTNIGYISDIHIEMMKKKEYIMFENHIIKDVPSSGFDVLLLAGDIGNPYSYDNLYKHFIKTCTQFSKHTLVLAGNHEYYQQKRISMLDIKRKIATICDEINIENNETMHSSLGGATFVDNDVFTYTNIDRNTIRFICSTLWSHIDPCQENVIYNCINDYNYIQDFTPKMSRDLYEQSSNYINMQLSVELNKTTYNVVVTHHAPSTVGVSKPCYNNSPLTSAFATDFKYSETAKPPAIWFFGHTHYNVACYDNTMNTLLLSNQCGYKGEDCRSEEDKENDMHELYDLGGYGA